MKLLLFICFLMPSFMPDSLDLRVEQLHDSILSIDTHNDFAMMYAFPRMEYSVTKGQVSFELMKKGRLDAAFFAAFQAQGPCTEEGHEHAKFLSDSMLLSLHRYAAEHKHLGGIAYSAQEVRDLKAQGKVAMLLSIENAYCLGEDISLVDHYYDLGVRMIGLTHNGDNCVADAGTDSTQTHGGLSAFGYEVIRRMNRLGIIVDVSHASRQACLQAVEASQTPIMASHSGVYALKPIPRNLTDKEIIAIAKKGGVIQISIGRYFLSTLPKAQVGLPHLVEHINYVVELVGIDHVGIGSDFDGGGGIVGVEDMGKMKAITRALLEEGYSESEIRKLWGDNVLRVMEAAETYAKSF
ncbi:MAG: membrane dipeptidase [Bacteroidales bacterium]|nr:membrane dipeptidase [Bacteroidales bacterium]